MFRAIAMLLMVRSSAFRNATHDGLFTTTTTIALISVCAASNQASNFGVCNSLLSGHWLRRQDDLQRCLCVVARPLASTKRQSCTGRRRHGKSVFLGLGAAGNRSTINCGSPVRMAYSRNSLGKPVIHSCPVARRDECHRCDTSCPARILRAWSGYRRIGAQTFLGR